MSDEQIRALASSMGVASSWTDLTGVGHEVGIDTLRALLQSLSIPCANDDDIRNSFSALEAGLFRSRSNFLTARVDQPVIIPEPQPVGTVVEVIYENGATRAVASIEGVDGAMLLPPFEMAGYHTVRTPTQEFTVAAAPARCMSISELTQKESSWGLGTQIYSLRRSGDGGIGDFGSVAALAGPAAKLGADAIAISPVHALYAANPHHFSPYSPSTRLFYNPLYADLSAVFPENLISSLADELGLSEERSRLEAFTLIDWPRASTVKMQLLRGLFDRLQTDRSQLESIAAEFDRFRHACTALLRDHAIFESIQAARLADDPTSGYWKQWPEELKRPDAPGAVAFAQSHERDVSFHIFLQWLTGKSYSECQRRCREAGMKIGLIADLAIGMDPAGSHAWSRQGDILNGLSIGAPPDYYNANGQSWGLTTFSPRGLIATGFEPFIDTLRASLRHVGGVRFDHIMGLRRLWLVPDGAKATEGAYLEYPAENMFRLLALESWRHHASVIGEDLGTVPDGFRDSLRSQAMAGMRVLRFERYDDTYLAPEHWEREAVAMTTTHDLVPTAGWWAGSDLEEDFALASQSLDERQSKRAWDRGLMWGAFEKAGVAGGERPEPWDTVPVVDAAVRFIAKTPCTMKLVGIEDALGTKEQPNVPGTTDEAPNWRHRLDGFADSLLDSETVIHRLDILNDKPAS